MRGRGIETTRPYIRSFSNISITFGGILSCWYQNNTLSSINILLEYAKRWRSQVVSSSGAFYVYVAYSASGVADVSGAFGVDYATGISFVDAAYGAFDVSAAAGAAASA